MKYNSLEITTAKICSVNCYPFCPQLKFRDAYANHSPMLSLENFRTVIDKIPKDMIVTFSAYSEPFMNPNALEMMEYAESTQRKVRLFTTLVGLKPSDIERLAKIKFDIVQLHLPEPNKIAHIPDNENYEHTLNKFIRNIQINAFSVMNDSFISNERAGNCDNAKPLHVRGPFACTRLTGPDWVLLPNCDVQLCCMDWQLKHKLGNLLLQSYDEIYHGETYVKIKRNRFAMDGDTLCRSCVAARSYPAEAAVRVYESAVGIFSHLGMGRPA